MCVSIVFGANLADGRVSEFIQRIDELGRVYEYGIGIGQENLLPGAGEKITTALSEPHVVFEVHDLPEPHCACDIDDDIRICSKQGQKSKFFDFIRETLEYEDIQSLSILFFQEELPDEHEARKHLGTYDDFVELLNRWNTWQVEGFEHTRRAYYIADEKPLFFTFIDKKLFFA